MQKRIAVLRSACKVLLNELNLYLAWSVPLSQDPFATDDDSDEADNEACIDKDDHEEEEEDDEEGSV